MIEYSMKKNSEDLTLSEFSEFVSTPNLTINDILGRGYYDDALYDDDEDGCCRRAAAAPSVFLSSSPPLLSRGRIDDGGVSAASRMGAGSARAA